MKMSNTFNIYQSLVSVNKLGGYYINPVVAKVGGLQSQGAKGEVVVNLLRTLGNAGSGILRLSRRVNNMASN